MIELAVPIIIVALFLIVGLALSLYGISEKRFWILSIIGGIFILIITVDLAGDPNITTSYNVGAAVNYKITPLDTFGLGFLGFALAAIGGIHGNYGW